MSKSALHILIVEDNPADVRLIQEMLNESRGNALRFEHAAALSDALALLDNSPADVILLDLSLPDSRGIETLAKIQEKAPHTPIIVLTGMEDQSLAMQAVQTGAQDYLIKGEVVSVLLSRSIQYAIERKQIELSIKENEEKARAISDSSIDAIIMIDGKGTVSYINKSAERMFGYDESEIIGKKLHSMIVSDEARKMYNLKLPAFEKTGKCDVVGKRLEVMASKKDGTRFPVEISISCFEINGEWHSVGTVHDITERRKTIKELEKLTRAVEQSPASVIITDTIGNIEYVNPKFTEMTGFSFKEAVGQNPRMLKSGEHPPEYYAQLWETILSGQEWRGEFLNKKKNNTLYWEQASISPIKNERGEIAHFVAVKEDVTGRKNMEKQLKEAAITDELTGLYNRRGFFTLSEKQSSLADRTGKQMSLLYIDLDNMKSINDKHGHEEGDRALVDVANILKKSFRKSDIISRIGGDEFAVLLTEHSFDDIEQTVLINLNNNLSAHNAEAGRPDQLSLSMGMSHFDPKKPCSIGDLLSQADALMYQHKKKKGR